MISFSRIIAIALVCALSACSGGEEKKTAAQIEKEEAASAVSVKVVRAKVEPIQNWVYSQGTARAVRREFLSFESAGRVAYVNPRLKIGRPVRRGQTIAYQETTRSQAELTGARSELSVAQASQREAAANLELARETFKRYKKLLEQNSASQQEYDEAEAKLAQAHAAAAKAKAQVRASKAQVATAGVTVSESRIISPINGVLARLNIEKGRYFSPQVVNTQSEVGALASVPVVVIDPSAYEITVDLPSYAFRQITVGSQVLIQASAAPVRATSNDTGTRSSSGPPIPVDQFEVLGVIDAISPSLDPEKRTFQAKIRTTTGASTVQDGEFVSVWMAGLEVKNTLVVPFDALRYKSSQPFLFVYNSNTKKVDKREVRLGVQGASSIEVLSGLKAGELIVTQGRAGLSEGNRVRLINQLPSQKPETLRSDSPKAGAKNTGAK